MTVYDSDADDVLGGATTSETTPRLLPRSGVSLTLS